MTLLRNPPLLRFISYVKLKPVSNFLSSTPDLVGIPDPEDGEGDHVLAPEDVPRPAATRHTRDFASK